MAPSTSAQSENPERVRAALSHLSPETRAVWVRQAMAIKSEFGEDGFEIWDRWSSHSEAYRAIDARDVWKSVKAGKGITIASLFYDAKQAGWKDDTSYKKPSPAEIEERRKARSERDALAAAQELAAQEAAALKAQELWAAAVPCEDHAYLGRKGVKSHGLRFGRFEFEKTDPDTGEVTVIGMQALLMPVMDRSGKIWTLQAFSAKADGRKSLLKNGRKSGNFFVIGAKPLVVEGRPVFILVEGYATGASLHEATGHMVVVCIDVGNLISVARQFREGDADAIIVVGADNDIWGRRADGSQYNPGVEAAKKVAAAVDALVVAPPFWESDATGKDGKGNPTGPKDWNDWHGIKGPGSVAEVINASIHGELQELRQQDTSPAIYSPHRAPLAIPQQIEAIENSDDALAMQFVECASNLRWSPGLGWMIDDCVTWSRDDALHRFDLARQVCRAVAAPIADKAEAEARRISSAKTVNAVVTLAQSDRRMVIPTSAWDADPLLLNTPGGIVDLRTGKMRERGIEYVTQAASVAPDFSADCSTWIRFLQQVFLGDAAMIEFMQRSMGYWLSGSVREQVIHFLHGQGSNGKSVLSDLIKWIVGSYGVKLTATALMQSRGERHPTELAQLRGKRLALSSELGEHDYFNEALLKELTGDATLSARFMRGDFFEFAMSQKHLIVGNFKPRLRGGDPAIARRMLLVPFNATFKGAAKDMSLPIKLKAEAPAILAWMIRGAVKWHVEGLAVPGSVIDASAEYMADHDDMAQWIAECCEMEGEAKASNLYASFSAWKKARGENAPSQTVWGSRLTAMRGISKRRSGGVRYSGIRLIAKEASIQALHDEAWADGSGAPQASSRFGSYSEIRG
nr:phage/plasmid primase, P4 family [uncultured Acidovorax sp.]